VRAGPAAVTVHKQTIRAKIETAIYRYSDNTLIINSMGTQYFVTICNRSKTFLYAAAFQAVQVQRLQPMLRYESYFHLFLKKGNNLIFDI
jgi:hypothetical protein